MPTELVVDTLDSIDEPLRAVYVEREGKHYLDPDKYAEFQAAGLKSKNSDLVKRLNAATTNLKSLDKFKPLVEALADADEDEITQLLEARGKPSDKNGKPDDAKHPDLELEKKLHSKAVKKLEEELNALRPENEKLKTKLRDFELWTPLRDIAIKAGLVPDDWD